MHVCVLHYVALTIGIWAFPSMASTQFSKVGNGIYFIWVVTKWRKTSHINIVILSSCASGMRLKFVILYAAPMIWRWLFSAFLKKDYSLVTVFWGSSYCNFFFQGAYCNIIILLGETCSLLFPSMWLKNLFLPELSSFHSSIV